MEAPRVLAAEQNGPLVAQSEAMREVLGLASRVARLETPVLLVGEPGVGKGAVARHIHRQSNRCHGPFVRVACASLHESEVDEKLFGRIGRGDGASRDGPPGLIESAHRGTLFLDAVSRLPAWAQAKLLDVVQRSDSSGRGGNGDGFPDVRLIAATARDLEAATAANAFHPQLYYYLNVVRLRVPPLRDRREDIRALAEHFLAMVSSVRGLPPGGISWRFSEQAWDRLLRCPWPGNAPQLAGVVARAVLLADRPEIDEACIAESLGPTRPPVASETISVPLAGGLTAMELVIVEEVIRRCHGNKAAAARSLGLHRRTLYRILKRSGSTRTRTQPAVVALNSR